MTGHPDSYDDAFVHPIPQDEHGRIQCMVCYQTLGEEPYVQVNDVRIFEVIGERLRVGRRSYVGSTRAAIVEGEEGLPPACGPLVHLTCVELYLRGHFHDNRARLPGKG